METYVSNKLLGLSRLGLGVGSGLFYMHEMTIPISTGIIKRCKQFYWVITFGSGAATVQQFLICYNVDVKFPTHGSIHNLRQIPEGCLSPPPPPRGLRQNIERCIIWTITSKVTHLKLQQSQLLLLDYARTHGLFLATHRIHK